MNSDRARVVIVGGNFAGLVAASRLSCRHQVTVIDPLADFEWTPNVHELLSGVKTREAVVLPRSQCVGRYGHRFLHDAVSQIDPEAQVVSTEGGLILPYDACLVAAGSQRTSFGIEGAEQHAIGLHRVDDAVRIAERLDKLARRKRRASVVIVGGGISGIEAVGEILRRRATDGEFDIHIVEADSRILGQLDEGLTHDALRRMSSYPVAVHTEAAIAEVSARHLQLEGRETLRADLCIWAAGMRMPDFLDDSQLNPEAGAWLPVDATLQSLHARNVFVAGDCAALPAPIRKQAYYAMDMGQVAGDNIARVLRGSPPRSFYARPMPMLVSLGDITTWLVAGRTAAASPVLAAAKEGIYQANMARLASPFDPLGYSSGIVSRAAMATRQLLVPQLTPRHLIRGFTGSRLLF